MATRMLRQGGVMRCCIDTLESTVVEDMDDGDTIQCMHTDDPDHQLIYRDGAWEWHRQEMT
ncbi:hypothetical protein LCGC14_1109280 [marine sediment metagenome]|uniref:Uncharacterized protein n=1 Tax=marine sediment metagenome TaxID=412755 RepID=A0A0F9MV65_9ZZZZ